MTTRHLSIIACSILAMSGCNIIYKQNIQQGNAIEQEKLEQLKTGMTMNQVAFLMGTPAIRDPFHQSRWDYYYSLAIRGGEPVTRVVTLRFENAVLKEIIGVDFDQTVAAEKTGESDTEGEASVAAEDSVDEAGPGDDRQATAESGANVQPAEQPAAPEAPPKPVVVSPLPDPVAEPPVELERPPAALPEAPAIPVPAPEPPAEPSWVIQLGAFDSHENARNLVSRAREEGFETSLTELETSGGGTRFLVRTKGYASKSEAEEQLQAINSALHIDGFLVPPENR